MEGYPVDNQGKQVDLTMAYVGTRALFEAAGFALASQTAAVSGGFPAWSCAGHWADDAQVPQ